VTPVAYHHGGGPELLARLDAITEIYLSLRDNPSPLFARDTFVTRTTSQAARPGFACTWATVDGELVGFSFGFTFGPDGWWSGEPTLPPPEILAVAKFAVIELDVSEAHQGQGIGRRLLDELLDDRPEEYAILTAMPDAPARAMYARWGWAQIGTARHTPDAPVMDQLTLRLAP
jgi:GNAT superfamily N-acetyltransferase